MEVRITAGKSDQGVAHIVERISPQLEAISARLRGDYGGPMDHLWIEVEISPQDADRRSPFAFRFQKSVPPPRILGSADAPTHHNVGRYSVRPDYFALARVPLETLSCFILQLVYDSTALLEKKRQLRGFDASAFRRAFRSELQALGCL